VLNNSIPFDPDQSNRANPHRFSFDDIKSAMLALFEVLSFKGWVDIREALLKRFDNSVSALHNLSTSTHHFLLLESYASGGNLQI